MTTSAPETELMNFPRCIMDGASACTAALFYAGVCVGVGLGEGLGVAVAVSDGEGDGDGVGVCRPRRRGPGVKFGL